MSHRRNSRALNFRCCFFFLKKTHSRDIERELSQAERAGSTRSLIQRVGTNNNRYPRACSSDIDPPWLPAKALRRLLLRRTCIARARGARSMLECRSQFNETNHYS